MFKLFTRLTIGSFRLIFVWILPLILSLFFFMHLHPPRSHRSLRSRFSFGQKNSHELMIIHFRITFIQIARAHVLKLLLQEKISTHAKKYTDLFTQHNKIVCLCLSVYYFIIFHLIFQNMHFTTFTSSARFPHSACSDHLRLRSMLVWFCVGSSNISFCRHIRIKTTNNFQNQPIWAILLTVRNHSFKWFC